MSKNNLFFVLIISSIFLSGCFGNDQEEEHKWITAEEFEQLLQEQQDESSYPDSEEIQMDEQEQDDEDEEQDGETWSTEDMDQEDEEETTEQEEIDEADEVDEQETDESEENYTIERFGNFTALYNTYIQDKIDEILQVSDAEVTNIEWIWGNDAKVNYHSNDQENIVQLQVAYSDWVIIQDIDKISDEETSDTLQEGSQDEDEEEMIDQDPEDDWQIQDSSINVQEHIDEEWNINFTSLYWEYVIQNLQSITGKEWQHTLNSIEWIAWTTARVDYVVQDENYLAEIDFSYSDWQVNIENYELVDTQVIDEATEEEDTEESQEDEQSALMSDAVNIDEYTDEEWEINYAEMYGDYIIDNFQDIIGRQWQNPEVLRWVEWTVARVRYEIDEDTQLVDIEMSYRNWRVNVEWYKSVPESEIE